MASLLPRSVYDPEASSTLIPTIKRVPYSGPSRQPSSNLRRSLLVHTIFFLIFTATWLLVIRVPTRGIDGFDIPPTSFHPPLQYVSVEFKNSLGDSNVFKGKPRQELATAWAALTKHRYLRAPTLSPDLDSIPLHDGGYLVSLAVFSQLVCLRQVQQWIYRDIHFSNSSDLPISSRSSPGIKASTGVMSGSDMNLNIQRVDSCINTLRFALQCHADIAVGTYNWREDHPRPWPNFNINHECRSWKDLAAWAEQNAVQL